MSPRASAEVTWFGARLTTVTSAAVSCAEASMRDSAYSTFVPCGTPTLRPFSAAKPVIRRSVRVRRRQSENRDRSATTRSSRPPSAAVTAGRSPTTPSWAWPPSTAFRASRPVGWVVTMARTPSADQRPPSSATWTGAPPRWSLAASVTADRSPEAVPDGEPAQAVASGESRAASSTAAAARGPGMVNGPFLDRGCGRGTGWWVWRWARFIRSRGGGRSGSADRDRAVRPAPRGRRVPARDSRRGRSRARPAPAPRRCRA